MPVTHTEHESAAEFKEGFIRLLGELIELLGESSA